MSRFSRDFCRLRTHLFLLRDSSLSLHVYVASPFRILSLLLDPSTLPFLFLPVLGSVDGRLSRQGVLLLRPFDIHPRLRQPSVSRALQVSNSSAFSGSWNPNSRFLTNVGALELVLAVVASVLALISWMGLLNRWWKGVMESQAKEDRPSGIPYSISPVAPRLWNEILRGNSNSDFVCNIERDDYWKEDDDAAEGASSLTYALIPFYSWLHVLDWWVSCLLLVAFLCCFCLSFEISELRDLGPSIFKFLKRSPWYTSYIRIVCIVWNPRIVCSFSRDFLVCVNSGTD